MNIKTVHRRKICVFRRITKKQLENLAGIEEKKHRKSQVVEKYSLITLITVNNFELEESLGHANAQQESLKPKLISPPKPISPTIKVGRRTKLLVCFSYLTIRRLFVHYQQSLYPYLANSI